MVLSCEGKNGKFHEAIVIKLFFYVIIIIIDHYLYPVILKILQIDIYFLSTILNS